MGTKNDPGAFDCYENAEPDEPMFVLLARDPRAPVLVQNWATHREAEGEDPTKVAEARECARQMIEWRAHRNRPVMRPFHGTVAFFNQETTDKRVVRDIEVRTLPLPVMTLQAPGQPGLSGLITKYEKDRHELRVWGNVDLPPAEYGCGVDLGIITNEHPAGALSEADFSGVLIIAEARLMGLTIYTGDNVPAWPDARITVREAPTHG